MQTSVHFHKYFTMHIYYPAFSIFQSFFLVVLKYILHTIQCINTECIFNEFWQMCLNVNFKRACTPIWFYLYVESKEQYKQTKLNQTYRHKKPTGGCQMGGGIGILGERSKGIRKYKLVVTKESQRYEVEHRARSQELR